MSDLISIQGPVESIDGKLVLRIPRAAAGDELASLAHGIGRIEGHCLVVVVEQWLAAKLRIGEGSLVIVDNRDGKFNLTPSPNNDEGTQ